MTIAQKTVAMVQLIRPELPVVAGMCVVVGQAIALGKLPGLPILALGFCLGFFLASSAMIYNDYFDLEVDRVNAPERPLPSGKLNLTEARVFGSLTALAALVVAWVIHPLAFLLALVTWVFGFLYNWKLKAAGLAGNLIVSASVAMTFILGGVSVGRAGGPLVWVFGLTAFVFDLAEEIAGDAMDMAGDRERASKSIAILYGKKNALRVSAVLFGLMILLTCLPVLWVPVGPGYLAPIALMDASIIYLTCKLLASSSPEAGRAAMRALYISAALGLLAFTFGSYIR